MVGARARQIYVTLRDRIVRGEYAPGDAIPGYPRLAAELGVAPMTVRRVLAQLEADGYVMRQPGRGTFVREWARPAVLVVDDDPEVRSVLAAIIQAAGYAVEEATSGEEAWAALRRRAFGHVFLDLRMPGGGPETIAAVRAAYPDTVVVVATAYPEEVLRPRSGLVTLLPKPFDVAAVEAALRVRLAEPKEPWAHAAPSAAADDDRSP
ncbi:MAG TPA: GntR family transcriptional regulator [Chloroflexota bacterium]|nr:GntR family transcriptional regulator [Chloroflexota bacterium]